MMNKWLLILCGLFPLGVQAGRISGEISGFVPYESVGKKILIFKLKNSVADSCNTTARFAFDQTKVNFDLMSATILAAFHAKTPVQVEYNKTCNALSNAFDARFVCLGDINC
jgi:hypothetical protein